MYDMTTYPIKRKHPNSPNPQAAAIARLYATAKYTTEKLASIYGITPRQVQRIAKKHGVLRTNAESNKLMAPLKAYHRVPAELRVGRKQLSNKLRLEIILAHPYCTICGAAVIDGIRLEVDHIDNDATNNDVANLQVLCGSCNRGKSHLDRFGATHK